MLEEANDLFPDVLVCVGLPDLCPCAWVMGWQAILDNSASPYAQLLAASSLVKVVTEHTLRWAPWEHVCRPAGQWVSSGYCAEATTLDLTLTPFFRVCAPGQHAGEAGDAELLSGLLGQARATSHFAESKWPDVSWHEGPIVTFRVHVRWRSRGPALEGFVVTALIQLLCRTTKLCWFDDDQFRAIVANAKRFLEKGSSVGGD